MPSNGSVTRWNSTSGAQKRHLGSRLDATSRRVGAGVEDHKAPECPPGLPRPAQALYVAYAGIRESVLLYPRRSIRREVAVEDRASALRDVLAIL